ncbi:hypothetical protein A2U01_0005470, partial [Trifolium medium]|nr:hypothetical protein [Trifolium medium]
ICWRFDNDKMNAALQKFGFSFGMNVGRLIDRFLRSCISAISSWIVCSSLAAIVGMPFSIWLVAFGDGVVVFPSAQYVYGIINCLLPGNC